MGDVSRDRLSDTDVQSALDGLPGWERDGDEIVKTFARASFPDAIAFVVRVGFLAEHGVPVARVGDA